MTRHKLKEIIYNSTSGNGFIFLVHNQFLQFNNKETNFKHSEQKTRADFT